MRVSPPHHISSRGNGRFTNQSFKLFPNRSFHIPIGGRSQRSLFGDLNKDRKIADPVASDELMGHAAAAEGSSIYAKFNFLMR